MRELRSKMESQNFTKWIDSKRIPSLRIGDRLFYVDAFLDNGRPDVAASHVYVPLSVTENNVFVREVTDDGLKMAVLAEYARENGSVLAVDPWRKAR